MGSFDPNTFLDVQLKEANSTQSVLVPVGEYMGVTEEPQVRNWVSKDGTKSGIAVDINISIDDANVRALLGRDKVSVKYGIMLDLNEGGGIDTGKGKNIALGRIREALDMNKPGEPFSFRMLAGRPLKVSVKHRVDGENIYADVGGVARPA